MTYLVCKWVQCLNLKTMEKLLLFSLLVMPFFSGAQKKAADLLVLNATIYTIDKQFSVKQAMAVKDGRIIETGTTQAIREHFSATNEFDAKGKFIYPGFIDAHAHFLGYGLQLQTVDLTGTKSWEECLVLVQQYAATHQTGWLLGRGWDQNDWAVKEFPTRAKLDQLFPDRPVLLARVDGHAAVANEKAMEGIERTAL